MKKFLAILVLSTAVVFTGCSNNKDTGKVIEEAKQDIEDKNYDKADVSLSSILGQDDAEGTANKLHSAIQNYDKAKDAIDSGKLDQASEALDKIDMNYIKNGMEDDISSLKNKLDTFKGVAAQVNDVLSNANDFMDNNKLDKYKQDLIKKLLASLNGEATEEKIRSVFNVIDKMKSDISHGSGILEDLKNKIAGKIDDAFNKKVVQDSSEEGRKKAVLDILSKAQSDIGNVIKSNNKGPNSSFASSDISSTANYGTLEEKKNNINNLLNKAQQDIGNVINSNNKAPNSSFSSSDVSSSANYGNLEEKKNNISNLLNKAQQDIGNVINSNNKAPNSSFSSSDVSSSANYGSTEDKKNNITDILNKGQKDIDNLINNLSKLKK